MGGKSKENKNICFTRYVNELKSDNRNSKIGIETLLVSNITQAKTPPDLKKHSNNSDLSIGKA